MIFARSQLYNIVDWVLVFGTSCHVVARFYSWLWYLPWFGGTVSGSHQEFLWVYPYVATPCATSGKLAAVVLERSTVCPTLLCALTWHHGMFFSPCEIAWGRKCGLKHPHYESDLEDLANNQGMICCNDWESRRGLVAVLGAGMHQNLSKGSRSVSITVARVIDRLLSSPVLKGMIVMIHQMGSVIWVTFARVG